MPSGNFNKVSDRYLKIPREAYQEIRDYYVDVISRMRNINKDPKTIYDILSKYTKVFKFNLTGTKYEFLNHLKPTLKVYFTYADKISRAYYIDYDVTTGKETLLSKHMGNIYLGIEFDTQREMLLHTIEHEVMHYIQELIGLHKKSKGLEYSIGGIQPRKAQPMNIDYNGWYAKHKGDIPQRGHHALRPVEFYPNLVICIRELQSDFNNMKRLNKNLDKIEFLKTFIEYVSNLQIDYEFGKSFAVPIFRKLKSANPAIYKSYLSKLYSVFMDEEYADASYIKSSLEKMIGV